MQIHECHPFRILLISSLKESGFFLEAIKSANINTRVALPDDKKRLESLLNKEGRHLPHLIFLDLVNPFENISEAFASIARCSILNSIPIILFTPLVSPASVVETFSGSNTMYVRKSQTAELLTLSIQNILKLDWRKYTTEKIHTVPLPSEKQKSIPRIERNTFRELALN